MDGEALCQDFGCMVSTVKQVISEAVLVPAYSDRKLSLIPDSVFSLYTSHLNFCPLLRPSI